MHPEKISIKDFSYELPENRIAKHPLEERDKSKLLIYHDKTISQDIFENIATYIPAETMIVFNNSKVIAARIVFSKATGSNIEIFCLEPSDDYNEINKALSAKETVMWKCLIGGAKKWKDEILIKKIWIDNKEIELTAKKIFASQDETLVAFSWNNNSLIFAEVLLHAGFMPLPPYLKRAAEKNDNERYQTIYAKHQGSVAAPTAGLHFTENVFKKFEAKKIQKQFVTLHVSAGTFLPVKSNTMSGHEMHSEFIEIKKEFLQAIITHNKKIIAVGTTSLRTIESLYWMGVKTILNNNCSEQHLHLKQWEPYGLNSKNITTKEALQNLLQWMQKNNYQKLVVKTKIIIAPGYTLKVADALITNFHQPQSTLLLLVAAITGNNWKKIYDYALQHNFRFLSYGDSSLLWADK